MKQLSLVVLFCVSLVSLLAQDGPTDNYRLSELEVLFHVDKPSFDYSKLSIPIVFLGNCEIISSSLGIGGISSTIKTGEGTYHVSSSIGQEGVIGTFGTSGYYFRQGFQQPLISYSVFKKPPESLPPFKIYPNPFKRSISISFVEIQEEEIFISVFDNTGRIVRNVKHPASPLIILPLGGLFDGIYILKITIGNLDYRTQLIKQYR